MARPKGISNAKLEEALRKSAGNLTVAAEKLGTSRQNVCYRVNNSPQLLAVCRDVEEAVGDLTEATIVTLIRNQDGPTARWYADRKLKRRGYGAPLAQVTVEGGASPTGGTTMSVTLSTANADL